MSDLTAKLVINLEGDLGARLDALFKKFETIRALTGKMDLGGFDKISEKLDQARSKAAGLKSQIDAVASAARRGAEEMNRMVSAMSGGGGYGSGGGGGGGGGSLGGGGGEQLLLEGPARRAIPLPHVRDWSGVGQHARNIAGAMKKFSDSTHNAMGQAFGAAAAGFGLVEPIKAAAEFDNTLQHIGITAGLSGTALTKMKASLGHDLTDMAMKTGQSMEKLADTMGYFGREGIGLPEAKELTGVSAKIATAYNATPEAAAHTAFALRENMGVSAKDMGGALSSLALAGKQADIPMEQMAQLFPNIAPSAGMLGEHGRAGVDDLGAMLAIARKNSGTPGEAATKLTDFMGGIASPIVGKHMKDMGIDIQGVVNGANKDGKSPILAVLEKLKEKNATGAFDLGKIFHNKEQREFAQAMLKHLDEFEKIRKTVASADPNMLQKDYEEGSKSLTVQLEKSEIAFKALEIRVGYGFAPVLRVVTWAMEGVNYGLDLMDQIAPGLSSVLLGVVGAVLAGVAAFAALGAIAGPISAGFGVVKAVFGGFTAAVRVMNAATTALAGGLSAPIIAIAALVAVFALAALDIYRHWDKFKPFFVALWNGVKMIFSGAKQAIMGVLTGDWSGAMAGVKKMMAGLSGVFKAGWNIVKGLFNDFLAWIDGWTSGLATKIENGVGNAFKGVADKAAAFGKGAEGAVGGAVGSAAHYLGFGGGGGGSPTHGEIVVKAEPGTSVSNVKSNSGAKLTHTPDRGAMLARP